MVGKGNLAVFESSNISKTGEAMPTKIGVHAFDINSYLHEFFEPFSNKIIFLMTMDYSFLFFFIVCLRNNYYIIYSVTQVLDRH